jgi:hypothetical protein
MLFWVLINFLSSYSLLVTAKRLPCRTVIGKKRYRLTKIVSLGVLLKAQAWDYLFKCRKLSLTHNLDMPILEISDWPLSIILLIEMVSQVSIYHRKRQISDTEQLW